MAGQAADIFQDEVCILEYTERAEIEQYAQNQERFARMPGQLAPDGPVDERAGQQDCQPTQVICGIEPQRHRQKKQRGQPRLVQAAAQIPACNADWQKNQHE